MKVESLHLYPIKSCAGIEVQEIEIEEAGPCFDRQWMIVNAEGKFLTQRTHPQMALIKPEIHSKILRLEIQSNFFDLPLGETDRPYEKVEVWSSKVKAQECSDLALQQALSEHLKEAVRLVRFGQQSRREAKKSGVGLGASTRFTDRAPLLVTSLSSLSDLNQRLTQEIPMSRFRPNVVLSGGSPWEEDSWTRLKVGNVDIEINQGCGRCPIVNIDQKTGVAPSKEVLLKLSEFRRKGPGVYFGVMGVHRSFGKINVKDKVLETH